MSVHYTNIVGGWSSYREKQMGPSSTPTACPPLLPNHMFMSVIGSWNGRLVLKLKTLEASLSLCSCVYVTVRGHYVPGNYIVYINIYTRNTHARLCLAPVRRLCVCIIYVCYIPWRGAI